MIELPSPDWIIRHLPPCTPCLVNLISKGANVTPKAQRNQFNSPGFRVNLDSNVK
jgi:hypothetical protein